MTGDGDAHAALGRNPAWPMAAAADGASPRPALAGRLLMLTGLWTASGVVLYAVAPLTAPAVLGLAVVAPIVWCRVAGQPLTWVAPSGVIMALAAAAAYLLINATWSPSPDQARATVTMLFIATMVLHVTAIALPRTPAPALRAMGIGLIAGLGLAAALLCFELVSEQWLRRLLTAYYPGLRPADRHMHVVAGQVTYLEPYLLNRCMAALGLAFWPALAVLERLAIDARLRRLLGAGLLLVPVAIIASHHGTSKLAFAGATVIYAIARFSPTLARRLLTSGWVVASLLVVPLVWLAYANGLYQVRGLDYSIRHRIVIWEHTRTEIAKAPVLGAGIHTMRTLQPINSPDTPRAPGTTIALAAPMHSHNGYLQVWHEAGAVGAALLLALGLMILRGIATAPATLRPSAYAMFAASALLAASSFSLWAPWFIAALALTPVFAGIAAALEAGDGQAPLPRS